MIARSFAPLPLLLASVAFGSCVEGGSAPRAVGPPPGYVYPQSNHPKSWDTKPEVIPPSPEHLAKADVGLTPDQSSCEAAARDFIGIDLRDPDSALYRFTQVKKGWYYSKKHEDTRYAWVLEFTFNAKNAYGGYVGYKLCQLFFVDGKIVAERIEDEHYSDGMRLTELVRVGSGKTAAQAGITP